MFNMNHWQWSVQLSLSSVGSQGSIVVSYIITHDVWEGRAPSDSLLSLSSLWLHVCHSVIPLTHFIPDSGELQGQFPLPDNGTFALEGTHARSENTGTYKTICNWTTVVQVTQDWESVMVCPPHWPRGVQNQEPETHSERKETERL